MSGAHASYDWLPLRGGITSKDGVSDGDDYSRHVLPFGLEARSTDAAPFHCSGDPYTEPDVMRGLTLAPAFGNQGTSGSHVSGDFYAESPRGPMRGLTLNSVIGSQGKFGGYMSSDCYAQCGSLHDMSMGYGGAGAWNNGYNTHKGVDEYGQNPSQDEGIVSPPEKPDDPHFELQVTTVYVPATLNPQMIWSVIEGFLKNVESSVTKVNKTKCTIKADVFVDGLMCTLKVRIYSMGDGRYAVEYQRKSGDALTFNAAYTEASSYMSAHLSDIHSPSVAPTSMRASTGCGSDLDDKLMTQVADRERQLTAKMAPTPEDSSWDSTSMLQDMAKTKDSLSQAEAAMMFAKISQDSNRAASLCSKEVVSTLNVLLKDTNKEVQYNAAVALRNIAERQQVQQIFSESDMSTFINRVAAGDTCPLVKEKVAQAIRNMVAQQGSHWQKSVRNALRSKLECVNEELLDESTRNLLKEALCAFDCEPFYCTTSSQSCLPGHGGWQQTLPPQNAF